MSIQPRLSDDLLNAHFRANADYHLVVFDRLSAEYQQQWQTLKDDDDFYGVLLPRDGTNYTVKTACQDTALLFLTLQQPSLLPEYIHRKFGEHCAEAVAELVLEGILEISPQQSTDFVHGAAAHTQLYTTRTTPAFTHRTAQLSQAALAYGAELAIDEGSILAMRLYAYNTLPYSAYWRTQLADTNAIQQFLRLNQPEIQAILNDYWAPIQMDNRPWWSWQSRHPTKSDTRASGVTYKLYFSPLPTQLPEVLPIVLKTLGEADVQQFKIGNTAQGLLRPDKFVIYSYQFEQLASIADRLQSALPNCTAQGVPFTASIDEQGLLSWGMDPPIQQVEARHSWRQWVSEQLAKAVLQARQDGANPVEYALARLVNEGVDVTTWAPRQNLWQS